MFTKKPSYYFDNSALQEGAVGSGGGWSKKYTAQQISYGGESRWVRNGKRNKRDVWTVPTKSFRGAHFAVFPEALIEPIILASTRPTDTVYDPFMGSGTTAVVAKRLNRNFIGSELNPEYHKIIEQRLNGELK